MAAPGISRRNCTRIIWRAAGAAAEAGWAVLAHGGSAVAAVEAAVRILEDHPVFDAGRGSHLNADGVVELDAGMMDGATLMAGAVASVKRVANPITLARHVLHDSPHVFLVGEGAERFAQAAGIPLCDPEDLVVPRERDALGGASAPRSSPSRWARSFARGRPTRSARWPSIRRATWRWATRPAARSTSTPAAWATRPSSAAVSTPTISLGAAACTGWGEQIMKTVLAKTTVDHIALLGSARDAAHVAIAYFRHRVGGLGGVICISPDGQIGFAHSTPYLAHAYRSDDMAEVVAALTAE